MDSAHPILNGACPYPAVAAPIAWEELDEYAGGNAFTVRDADRLIERTSSKLLAGWGKAKQALPKA